jgi:hypothetical protein
VSGTHAIAAALAGAILLLVSIQLANAGKAPGVAWSPSTRAHGHRFAVNAGSSLAVTVRASSSPRAAPVHIVPARELPAGAEVDGSAGRLASATLRWRPTHAGDYTISLRATTDGGASALRTYSIHVRPKKYPLTDAKIGHWGFVLRPAIVRTAPHRSARAITTLRTNTTDGTHNLVLVLDRIEPARNETWYRIRLPILPNNSTGWVPRAALGPLHAVQTHLYVDRAKLTATLKRDGRTVFSSSVGVGKPYWPTPRGNFYVRSELTRFHDPFYGPIAFGTSGRSNVLTDWPGGGFIGIHGTDAPRLLPGYVSHGCIRMRNRDIVRLARLMPVGTPITIR